MDLLAVTFISIITWTIFKYICLPIVKDRSFHKSKFPALTKISWIALISLIKRFAFVAFLTYGGIWAFLKILDFSDGFFIGSEKIASNLFTFLTGVSAWINSVDYLKFYVIFFLLAGILVLVYIRKIRMGVYDELRKIIADLREGKLEDLDPTSDMRDVNLKIKEQERQLNRLNSTSHSFFDGGEEGKLKAVALIEENIQNLREHYFELDAKRRVYGTMDAKGSEPPKGFLNRLLILFSSTGMVNLVHKTGKVFTSIGLAMVMLSFLAATSPITKDMITDSTKGLFDVQVRMEQQKLDKEWVENLKSGTPLQSSGSNPDSNEEDDDEPIDWNDENLELLDEISRIYELSIAEEMGQPGVISTTVIGYALMTNAVKSRIVSDYADYRNKHHGTSFNFSEPGKHIKFDSPESDFAKRFSHNFSKNIHSKKPVSSNGRKFRANLKSRVDKDPKSWKRIKAERSKIKSSKNSFSTTATPRQVLGSMIGDLVNELTGKTLDEVSALDKMEGKVVKEAFGQYGDNTVRRMVELKQSRFTNDLYSKGIKEAVQNSKTSPIGNTKFSAFTTNSEIPLKTAYNELVDFPSAVDHKMDANQATKARRAVEALAKSDDAKLLRYTESLSDFNRYFPGQAGADASSNAAKALKHSRHAIKPLASASASRARNFKALKGFRRIGGVLIGKEPTNTGNTGVEFNDITWEKRDTGLEIYLHRKDGEKISAGIFEEDILNQALAYVSDGRLTTVTMVTGNPIPMLKILTHPTLLDTELGCNAINLDRFVDKYASGDNSEQVDRLMKSYGYQEMLYKYAVFKFAANKADFSFEIDLIMEQFESVLEKDWDEIYNVLNEGRLLMDEESSHMWGKGKYYEQSFLEEIYRAMQASDGIFSIFVDAMGTKEIDADDAEKYLKVEVEQWSGVREQDYEVDADLNFLKQNDDHLFPFRFMRQLAYSPLGDNDGDNDISDPWEFPALERNNTIGKLVWLGVGTNSNDRYTLERMASFAIAQRLFRVIMNGDLGTEFPVEKLHHLSSETLTALENRPTPTWNMNVPDWESAEMILMLRDGFEEYDLEKIKRLWDAEEVDAEKNRKPCE